MAEIFTRFKNHDITLTRDGDDKNWYIRVRGPDGLHAYDGYWRDSAGKTAKEALYEAKHGAMLVPASPSMDQQRKRELAARGVRVLGHQSESRQVLPNPSSDLSATSGGTR